MQDFKKHNSNCLFKINGGGQGWLSVFVVVNANNGTNEMVNGFVIYSTNHT